LTSNLINEAIGSLKAKNLDFNLFLLKEKGMISFKEDKSQKFYIPNRCIAYEKSEEERDPQELFYVAQKFMKSKKKVFVIIGNSGSGKSLFLQKFEHELLNSKDNDYIVFYIKLADIIHNPEQTNLINKFLNDNNLDKFTSQLQNKKILFLLDGYDEITKQSNIYDKNNFKSFKACKIIITCREERIPKGFNAHIEEFTPDKKKDDIFEPRKIEDFNIMQIEHYLIKYAKIRQEEKLEIDNKQVWKLEDYLNAFENIEGLQNLCSNPFLLFMVADSLPKLNISKKEAKFTKNMLYKHFCLNWITTQLEYTNEFNKTIFENNEDMTFTIQDNAKILLSYCYTIVKAMYEKENPVIVLDKKELFKILNNEKDDINDPKLINAIIRTIPIKCKNELYSFLHKSIYEYLVSMAIILNLDSPNTLNKRVLKEVSIIKFLSGEIKADINIQEKLWDIIEKSKTEVNYEIVSSNAATLLNSSNIDFINRNLSGIQIPYADLRNALIYNSNFSGANMQNSLLSSS
jgi:hypothetical protein